MTTIDAKVVTPLKLNDAGIETYMTVRNQSGQVYRVLPSPNVLGIYDQMQAQKGSDVKIDRVGASWGTQFAVLLNNYGNQYGAGMDYAQVGKKPQVVFVGNESYFPRCNLKKGRKPGDQSVNVPIFNGNSINVKYNTLLEKGQTPYNTRISALVNNFEGFVVCDVVQGTQNNNIWFPLNSKTLKEALKDPNYRTIQKMISTTAGFSFVGPGKPYIAALEALVHEDNVIVSNDVKFFKLALVYGQKPEDQFVMSGIPVGKYNPVELLQKVNTLINKQEYSKTDSQKVGALIHSLIQHLQENKPVNVNNVSYAKPFIIPFDKPGETYMISKFDVLAQPKIPPQPQVPPKYISQERPSQKTDPAATAPKKEYRPADVENPHDTMKSKFVGIPGTLLKRKEIIKAKQEGAGGS